MKEWIWYLFKDGKIFKESKNIEELKQEVVNMQLHTDTYPYFCKLDTIKLLDEFSDIQENVWHPTCNVLNEKDEIVDIFIVLILTYSGFIVD